MVEVAHRPSECKVTVGPSSDHKAGPSLQRGTPMVTSHSGKSLALSPTSLSSPAPSGAAAQISSSSNLAFGSEFRSTQG